MVQAADPVTVSVPRHLLADIVRLSADLTDRMHELLERNTNGELSATERAELDTLVQIAEFGQIISMAVQPPVAP